MRGIAAALLAATMSAATPALAGSSDAAKGQAALDRHAPREARVLFLNAVADDPRNPAAHIGLARSMLLLARGLEAEAAVHAARAAGAPQQATAALMAEALVLQQRYRPALIEAMGAGDSAAAWRARAKALAGLDRYSAARDAFGEAIARAPRSATLWIDIGRFRLEGGDQAGAILAGEKAIALGPADPAAVQLKAELVRTQYGLVAALAWFDRALALDAQYVPAMVERAATLGDIGRYRDMLAQTRAVLAVDPTNARAFFLQAVLAARAGDHALARKFIARTDGRLDDQPAMLLLAGAVDFAEGAYGQAADGLGRLVIAQPDNIKARRLLAAALWRGGDAAATRDALLPVAQMPTADSYCLMLLARAQEALGQRDQAAALLDRIASPVPPVIYTAPGRAEVAALERAVEDDPALAGPRAALIRALLLQGRTTAALDNARYLLRGHPGVPAAHLLVGDALLAAGNPRAAAVAYRTAANIAFTEPAALRLIEALERSGQSVDAARVLALFAGQNPRNVPARLLLADRRMRTGGFARAAALLESVRRETGEGDVTLLNNLAWARYRIGDIDGAAGLATRAYALLPANPALVDTNGWMLFSSGRDRRRGLSLIEEAARRSPEDPGVARHLAEAVARSAGDKLGS